MRAANTDQVVSHLFLAIGSHASIKVKAFPWSYAELKCRSTIAFRDVMQVFCRCDAGIPVLIKV